jgi:hypothetical protein
MPRIVPEFSHAQHMKRPVDPARAAMQCATCHPFNASKGAKSNEPKLVSTLAGAADCTMCHQHDAAHAEWTGKIQGSDVASCKVCHEDRMPSRTFHPVAKTSSLIALSGAQFHPDDRSCEQCHLDTMSAQPPSTAVIEASGSLFTIHGNNKYPGDCRSCHWALEVKSLGNEGPTLATRRREGASLVGFPGGKDAGDMRARFLGEAR